MLFAIINDVAFIWLIVGNYSARVGKESIAISLSVCVCLCVCHLSVREHIARTAGPIFTKFVVQIPVTVYRSSSGGVAICHVLPVLWMTSRLAVVGRMVMRD